METLLVLPNWPDAETANTIAVAIVEARLAAGVNILPRVQSIYRWQGGIESVTEIPVLIKSTAASYPALEEAIRALHPHEIPEIIALPIDRGLPAYLNWVVEETLQ